MQIRILILTIAMVWNVSTLFATERKKPAADTASRIVQLQDVRGLVSNNHKVRQQSVARLLAARKRMVAELSKIVAAPRNHAVRRDSVRKAMELLGELRAREGIDALVTHIGFPWVQHPDAGEYPPPGGGGKNIPPPKGSPHETKWLMQQFPAVPALIKIGEPCIDAVIHKLCNTDHPSEQRLCVLVLKELNRPASIRERIQLSMPKVLPRRLRNSPEITSRYQVVLGIAV